MNLKQSVVHTLTQPLISKIPNLTKEEGLRESGVEYFPGFYENAFRLLFPFEDHYPLASAPHLLTILPSGKVENDKQLKPEKEKGLLAYGYPQTIDEPKVTTLVQAHKDAVAPFIWKRDEGNHVLVQTWTTNYNAKFKTDFREYATNVCPLKFQPQAVREFEQAMEKLFGDKDCSKRVKFVVSSKRNDKPVYIGRGDQLIKLLRSSHEVQKELDIITVLDDGFLTRIVYGKEGKEPGQKEFHMDMEDKFALYVKQGYETMACSKPLKQFFDEAALELPRGDRPEIPPCLLASPLPPWSYHPDVARLFFNDDNLIKPKHAVRDIPRPIPMQCCVAPALPWAFWRAFILWACVGLTTLFDYLLIDHELDHALFLHYHRFLFFLAIIFGFWAEWHCMRLFIVPFVERVHGCAAPLLGHLPFRVWLPLMLIASFVSMVSIQTNAEFMLAVIKREHAVAREVTLWKYLMQSSMFGSLGINWEVVNPSFFVGFLWIISTMQFVLPLLEVSWYGAPQLEFRVLYDYDKGGWQTWETLLCKLRIRGGKMDSFEALLEMAYAGGMSTVLCGTYTYPLGCMRDMLIMKRENWLEDAMTYLNLAQKQAVKRLVIDGFLKMTLQLKIQVTLYSLSRSMSRSSTVSWSMLIPILVTLFAGLGSQADLVLMCLKKYYEFRKQYVQELKDDHQKKAKELARYSFYIAFWGVLIAWGAVYSCLQLIMLHTCPTSLWNLAGCVTEDELHQIQ